MAIPSPFVQLATFQDAEDFLYEDDPLDDAIPDIQKITKANNVLPVWGNGHSMNLNSLVLENIVASAYYRNNLAEIKTYNQIADEIYYNVCHLEPWERGTRKTTGQTGMCGGVRGVGAGGVVSSAYCFLYKLFTMRITRKLLVSMINREDSCYIRGIGFMFIRYSQPPADLWSWMEPYLLDEEEIDPKAGGGDRMTIGQMVKLMLTKLDWFGTLFPRIPVPIQKQIEENFRARNIAARIEEAWQEKKEEDATAYKEDNRNEERGNRGEVKEEVRIRREKVVRHHHDHSKHRHKDGERCSKYNKWLANNKHTQPPTSPSRDKRSPSRSRSESKTSKRRSRSPSRSKGQTSSKRSRSRSRNRSRR